MKHERAPPANAVAGEAGEKAMREKREDGAGAAAARGTWGGDRRYLGWPPELPGAAAGAAWAEET
jgi:hypothetical protein